MKKERVINESKNYLIFVHDTLRRTFINAEPSEKIFIDTVLEGIEKDVKHLEMLEEMLKVCKSKKDKKLELIEE